MRRQSACDIREGAMKSTIGRPRVLTDEQVRAVLDWHREVMAWRASGGALKTRKALALEFGVSPSTITRVIARRGEYKQRSPDERNDP
jgi:transposase